MKKMRQHSERIFFFFRNETNKKDWLIIPLDWIAFTVIPSRDCDEA